MHNTICFSNNNNNCSDVMQSKINFLKCCRHCNTSMTTLMTKTVPILVTKEISITILTTITITLTKPLSGNQGFFVGIVFNPALPKEVCHHHSLQACTQAHILTFKYIGEKFMLMNAH